MVHIGWPHWLHRVHAGQVPKRFVIVLLAAGGLLISYADRSNMSVAIVSMGEELSYSKSEQGIIMSSFFGGYILTQVAGGALSDRLGGKLVLETGAYFWTAFTLLTPIASHWGLGWLILCRVCLGLGEGVAYPAIHALIASWIPPCEKSKAVSMVTAFSYLGSVVALPTSSALVSSTLGWRSIFYVFGSLGILWSIAWKVYGASSPSGYHGISGSELSYILGQQATKDHRHRSGLDAFNISSHAGRADSLAPEYQPVPTDHRQQQAIEEVEEEDERNRSTNREQHDMQDRARTEVQTRMRVPWQYLLRQKEVWAVILSQFWNSWGFYILVSWLPTYYHDVFGVDIKQIGYFAVLPSILQASSGILAGFVGDAAIQSGKISPLLVRQLAQSIGSLGTGLFLFVAALFARSATEGMLLMSVGLTFNGWTMIGSSVFLHELCPDHAGFIFSLGNTAATIPAIVGTALVGFVLDRTKEGEKPWNTIWSAAFACYVIGTLCFVCLSSNRKLKSDGRDHGRGLVGARSVE